MPSGNWAFLHESVIYEYMISRNAKNMLRVRPVVSDGKSPIRNTWTKVIELESITDTYFPDITGIRMKDDSKGNRQAEVKFITSKFNYHKDKKYKESYPDFVNKKGCIIVLRHDYLPPGLIESYPLVDVYELDVIDFISYANENFIRFINRQINYRDFSKVWLMLQSMNFYKENDEVPAARTSGRWCPTETLTSFDLAKGDKIIFLKFGGISFQEVNKIWLNEHIYHNKVFIDEIWVGRVTLPILSREEYCSLKKYPLSKPLWYDETDAGKNDKRVRSRKDRGENFRWNRVFEFEKEVILSSQKIYLRDFSIINDEFANVARDVYTSQKSREISQELYTSTIEQIAFLNLNRQTTGIEIPISTHQEFSQLTIH